MILWETDVTFVPLNHRNRLTRWLQCESWSTKRIVLLLFRCIRILCERTRAQSAVQKICRTKQTHLVCEGLNPATNDVCGFDFTHEKNQHQWLFLQEADLLSKSQLNNNKRVSLILKQKHDGAHGANFCNYLRVIYLTASGWLFTATVTSFRWQKLKAPLAFWRLRTCCEPLPVTLRVSHTVQEAVFYREDPFKCSSVMVCSGNPGFYLASALVGSSVCTRKSRWEEPRWNLFYGFPFSPLKALRREIPLWRFIYQPKKQAKERVRRKR